MPAAAKALAAALAAADPAHKSDYDARLKTFLASLKPLNDKIAAIRAKFAGAPVTASEPVFGYMAAALGLTDAQRTLPALDHERHRAERARRRGLRDDLKDHKVRVMFFNKQASDKAVAAPGQSRAQIAHVPVVGVTETAPPASATRTGCWTNSTIPKRRWQARLHERHRTRPRHHRDRRPQRSLPDVSFAIDAGEFIGVLGPNGAGKTTLMRAILGLLPPSAGTLRVFGRAPQRGDPAIGYLPQVRTVLPDLRVRGLDFIASSLQRRALGPALAVARATARMIEETLARGRRPRSRRRPLSDMSGGERQRLLLAQALIGAPKLLLLDEPLISLDPRHQEVVIDVVRKVCRERKITVLFSAHELNQLLGTLDRVLYLGNGQAALGTVDEVVTAPVLSRLYGTEIDVLRADGHIFVMSRGRDVERADHLHDHGHDHGHDAHHHH